MHLTPTETLHRAMVDHEAGRLAEAEQLYRHVLGVDPRNPQALHYLGVIAMQVGRPEYGLPLLRLAVEVAPDRHAFWEVLLNSAIQSGRQEYGREVLAAARRHGVPEGMLAPFSAQLPMPAESEIITVATLYSAGRYPEGVLAARKLAQRFPWLGFAWKALGLMLHAQGQSTEAIGVMRRAIALEPADAETYGNLSEGLRGAAVGDDVIRHLRRALSIRPDFAEAWDGIGLALRDGGTLEQSENAHRLALLLKPDLARAYDNLGITLRRRRQLDPACRQHRRALAMQPEHPGFISNYSAALSDALDLDRAERLIHRSLALQPMLHGAWISLGNVRHLRRMMPAAEIAFRRAITITPDHSDGHRNLAQILLTIGRYEEGFREYEWRMRLRDYAATWQRFPQPHWQGEPAEGRTMLVYSEQGFGDVLQICRYIPLLARRGIRVIFEVRPELARLMTGLAGVERLVTAGTPLPPFDLQCSVMSLPFAFGTTLHTVPGDTPYLTLPATLAATWRERVEKAADGRLKVGLLWAGNPMMWADHRRSVDTSLLAPLAAVADLRFFSLQKDYTGDLPEFGGRLIDLMDQVTDFADTAAMIAALDLVIAVDSAISHLAGAVGTPVWLLARHDTDWRWLEGRDDSPWYPKLRVFRQQGLGPASWPEVIDRVRAALIEFTS